ncbi:MAG: zinc ribbon domain-containing protein, partial [Chloroflexota bacterium]|nr:zinc ribbon domain-containing protein [Chloroflexota bacterium]
SDEYKCCQCGNTFKPIVDTEEKDIRCPRSGSDKVERVKYLFGTESAEGLTPQDYFDAYLRP